MYTEITTSSAWQKRSKRSRKHWSDADVPGRGVDAQLSDRVVPGAVWGAGGCWGLRASAVPLTAVHQYAEMIYF